jgi:hypothetical protein
MLNRFSAPRRCPVAWLVTLLPWLLTPVAWLLTPVAWLATPITWLATPIALLATPVALLTTPVAWQPADARTLLVGPTRVLVRPSAAAAVATDGDTVQIDPGNYTDCAVWRANHLTITARSGGDVVLRDRVCQNKGIFVTVGDDITIRGITFAGARAPAYNGAGIRAQGANLTLIDSRFLDNENGVLAAAMPSSTIRVFDSEFRGNGACVRECAHGIYVGRTALLDIERSRFVDQHIGHHIKSRALRTVLIDDTIMDGPDGTSSYLVDLPNGGDLLMRGCVLEKGPNSDNPVVAVTIGEEALTNPTRRIELLGNRFRNDRAQPTVFLRNDTKVSAELTGNQISGPVVTVDGPASVQP